MTNKKNIDNPKYRVKRKAPQNEPRVAKKLKLDEKQKEEIIIRQKQTRITMLWHVSHCRSKNCIAKKKCNRAKELWEHISKCKDNNCNFKHCLSSRYILGHYHHCRDKKCKICPPVRKAIEKKEKEIAETTASEALMLLQSLS